ncbi:MAG TPA: MBL fold metallo-hydrolase [Bacteroidales bacterium]
MLTIRSFVFNSFGVNTYVLYDESRECIIIDPACQYPDEEDELAGFIGANNLNPVRLINTHTHIDHILGNTFISEKYNLIPETHSDAVIFLDTAQQAGAAFGVKIEKVIFPVKFLGDGDTVKFGNSLLRVLYTPGHAAGSICLVSDADSFVVTGDVLFQESIGRTDLPTGDLDLLLASIREKLFTLPDSFKVYPGHGPATSIGFERRNNPFIS